MKRPLIIANWKSNKTPQEVTEWFAEIAPLVMTSQDDKKVIICPPFPLLPLCQQLMKHYQLPWELGSQDISAFDQGRHTGEVSSVLLKEFVTYALIGHSERRQQLGETEELLAQKVKQAQAVHIEPLFFVQTITTPFPQSLKTIVYEPPSSISPHPADTPEDVEKAAKEIKKDRNISVLYGGNVTAENINSFMSLSSIDGIIAGNASLSPQDFAQLIHNA